LTAVAQLISPEGLGPEGAIIQRILTKVRVLQELKLGSPGSVRYEKKVVTVTRSKTIPGKRKKAEEDSPLGKIVRIGIVAIIGAVIMTFFLKREQSFSPSDLQIGIPVDSIRKSDKAIVVSTQSGTWRNLPKKSKEGIASQVETFMKNNDLMKAMMVDEQGRELVAILAQETPTGTIYQRSFAKR
jgi:hypothetical protein